MNDRITLNLRGFPASLRTALNVYCAAHHISQADAMADALNLFLAVHSDRLIEIDAETRDRLEYVLRNAVAPAEVA